MNAYPPALPVLERIVTMALEEDVARGDLTSESTVSPDTEGRAVFRAREPLVLSGWCVVRMVYQLLDPAVRVEAKIADGTRMAMGEVSGRRE